MWHFRFFSRTLLGLLAVLSVRGGVAVSFRDVSIENGFLSYEQMHKRNVYNNKYWGASVADINRDGKYDVFMSNHGNNPECYIAKEDGGFVFRDPNKRSLDIHSSAVADMDNDGFLDIVVTHGGGRGTKVNGTPVVHLGNQLPVTLSKSVGADLGLGGVPMRGRSSSFLDVNGNGNLDLLLINARNHSAVESHLLYKNRGNGTFKLIRKFGAQMVDAKWFALIDANDDSYLDLLMMKGDGPDLRLGTGKYTFKGGNSLLPPLGASANIRAAAEFDYDGDGDMDLIAVRGSLTNKDLAVILLEKTDRGYKLIDGSQSKIPDGNYYHVTVGDLNNDGFPDIYLSRMTHFKSPRVNDYVLINNGDKSFSRVLGTGTETAGTDTDGDNAMIVDFDMDGKPDLLVGSRNSPWKLYKNTTPLGSRHYVHVRIGYPRAELTVPTWFRRKSLGALVKVFCGGKAFLARVGSPGQSHSQSYMDTLHFGLGACTNLQRIEVHYTGSVVVTRTHDLAVDRVIEVGVYFPCPAGFTGRDCNQKVLPCSTARCEEGEACEVAELVRDKCDKERCKTGGAGTELLVNGSFDSAEFWMFNGAASLRNSACIEGRNCLRLKTFSGSGQDVILEGGRQYTLTCKVAGSVLFKIRRNNAIFVDDDRSQTESIPDSRWMQKSTTFVTDRSGVYRVLLDTERSQSGVVDACSLKRTGSSCNSRCLKLHCPI